MLIVSSTDDIYYSPEFDSVPIKDLVENSKIIFYESKEVRMIMKIIPRLWIICMSF